MSPEDTKRFRELVEAWQANPERFAAIPFDLADFLLSHASELLALVEAEGEVADLKQTVIAFAGPVAARYALDAGFSNGVLHPHHYDLLARCGARMVDFKRGELPATKETP